MNYFTIEHLIFYAFLGITALVGSWGTAAKSIREYTNANKNFGAGALTMTLLATYVGGGMIFLNPQASYRHGISLIMPNILLGEGGQLLLILLFVAPKIVYFQNCMTVGDLMKVFYGETARRIAGVVAFYYCTCICAFQFNWLLILLKNIGIDETWGLALGVGILAFYTARGGMRAVTVTDILHFVVALGIFPLLAHLMLHQAGGIRAILNALSPKQAQLFSIIPEGYITSGNTVIGTLFLSLLPRFTLSFPFIQRLLMARHQQQSISMYRRGVGIAIPFIIILGLIGVAGIVLYPDLDSSYVLVRAVEQLPPVSKALVWVAVAGIIISTIDSFLHTAGTAFVHDTLKPLTDSWGIKLDELKAVKYTVLITALGAYLMFMAFDDFLSFYVYGLHFIGLILFIPLIAGIMGMKTDSRSFYICVGFTSLVFVTATVFQQPKDIVFVGSMLTSLASYFGTHYYYNRGFVTVNRSTYGQTTSVWHPSWQGTGATLTSLIPTPQKVVRYFQERVAENNASTTTLAFFIATSYMVPLFMHSIGQPEAYNWLLVLRIGGALLCVGLMLQSQWSASLLRFFPIYYHFTLLYCFPFMTTFLFLLEGGSIEWVINVMLSIMIFIMLLDYITAAGLFTLGIALAVGLYKAGIGPLALSMSIDVQYLLAYGVGFSIIVGILFQRIRERFLRQANRRLVHQEAALEAHFPAVMAESERRTRAFQQMGVKGFLDTARKLHTIQHKTVAAQQEQQALFTSLAQRHETLTQQQKVLLNAFSEQKISQAEFLAQQEALSKQQEDLQAEFNTLTKQQLAPQPELTAVDQSQAPQAELQTLAQHHLSPQAELNSLAQQQQDLQADLLPLVMQLQDLDTRGKDHLTLKVKKDLPIDQFLLSLQEKLLPRGIDVPLLTERKTKQTKLTADVEQLAILLVKGIASLQWLLHDEDQYLLLGLEDTQLSYPLPDVAEGYVKQVPALRITLTATEELPPLEASYRPYLTNFVPETQLTFQEMEDQADRRLIKAHYGYTEVSEDTLIYVVPVDVYEVRPLDMDKPELAIGALPKRANDHFMLEIADAQAQEQAFLKEVETKSKADLGIVKLALNLIKWYHGHKNRHSGEPFYLHPLAVAQIVMDYDQDEATIVGALLHDTVEDTPMLMGHIEALFGKETAEVVDLATHLQSIPGSMYKIKLSAEENLKMLGTTLNRRSLYVKLADRMHNMRTINGHPKVSKRKLVARETMDFFVPLAEKLGLKEAAAEFRKMCEEVFQQKD